MHRVGKTQDMAVTSSHALMAVRLDGKPLPDETPSSWFVGVGCRRCGTIYALAMPKDPQNVHAIFDPIAWVEAKMGLCGAHPDLLIQGKTDVQGAPSGQQSVGLGADSK